MGTDFVDTDRSTPFIMPPSVDDWLPEGHLARFVVEIVDQLDVRNLTDQYGGKGGSKAYPPRMMLGLLFYAYATGTHSSRQIERKTYEDIAYRYIACNHHPDHASICNFRRRFLREVEQLFVQVLLIAHQMSVLKIGVVSLDGTKIKANASKHRDQIH